MCRQQIIARAWDFIARFIFGYILAVEVLVIVATVQNHYSRPACPSGIGALLVTTGGDRVVDCGCVRAVDDSFAFTYQNTGAPIAFDRADFYAIGDNRIVGESVFDEVILGRWDVLQADIRVHEEREF